MKKRAYIIHGWEGHPKDAWIPWLKNELETRGFEVLAPQMPGTEQPRIPQWLEKLQEVCPNPDKDTYFVCHSMGCKATAKFLEALPQDTKIGGVVFLAGFFKRLTNLEVDEPGVAETAKLFLETPIDLQKVRSHITKSIAIFSDNDRFVPLDNQNDFRDQLGSEIQISQDMDHFWTKSPDWKEWHSELPLLLDAVKKITEND